MSGRLGDGDDWDDKKMKRVNGATRRRKNAKEEFSAPEERPVCRKTVSKEMPSAGKCLKKPEYRVRTEGAKNEKRNNANRYFTINGRR